jgi:hypothetical protein
MWSSRWIPCSPSEVEPLPGSHLSAGAGYAGELAVIKASRVSGRSPGLRRLRTAGSGLTLPRRLPRRRSVSTEHWVRALNRSGSWFPSKLVDDLPMRSGRAEIAARKSGSDRPLIRHGRSRTESRPSKLLPQDSMGLRRPRALPEGKAGVSLSASACHSRHSAPTVFRVRARLAGE